MAYKRKLGQFYNRYFNERFWDWFRNWKPLHLCQFFKKKGWRIPKYLVGHPDTEEQTTYNTPAAVYTGTRIRIGQKLTISDRTVSKLSFPICKHGSPTGNVTFTIRKVSDDSIIASKVWGDASALPVETATWEEVTFDSPVYINEEVYILVEFSGGDVDNCIWAYYQNTDVKANEYQVRYITSYTDYTSWDSAYIYTHGIPPIERTIAESMGINDSVVRSHSGQRLIQDSEGISDSIIRSQGWAKLIQDNVGITDILSYEIQHLVERLIQDDVGITDILSRVHSIQRLLEENEGITDLLSQASTIARIIIDNLGITDALSYLKFKVRLIQDNVGITDEILFKLILEYLDKYSKQGDSYTDKHTKQGDIYKNKFKY